MLLLPSCDCLRVKAQKAAADQAPNEEPAVKPAAAAAIAKAKAKQAAAQKAEGAEPDNSEMSKLREERKRQARERKAQQAAADTPAESSGDGKKDAVAAAIARAKAKKVQCWNQLLRLRQKDLAMPRKMLSLRPLLALKRRKAQQAESASDAPAESTGDAKKDAVVAAIARAKAKKAHSKRNQLLEAPVEALAMLRKMSPRPLLVLKRRKLNKLNLLLKLLLKNPAMLQERCCCCRYRS